RFQEPRRDAPPDTAGAAGDEDDTPVEPERPGIREIGHLHRGSFQLTAAPPARALLRQVRSRRGAGPTLPDDLTTRQVAVFATAPGGGVADKRCTEDDVVAELRDGMTVGIGGWGSRRKP